MTVSTVMLETDMRNRWRPSDAQIERAREVFKWSVRAIDARDYVYVVPIILRNKSRHVWTAGVGVETIDNYGVLAYVGRGDALWPSVTRNRALTLIEEEFRHQLGPDDMASYAYIHADGRWAVWECI